MADPHDWGYPPAQKRGGDKTSVPTPLRQANTVGRRWDAAKIKHLTTMLYFAASTVCRVLPCFLAWYYM